MKARVPGYISAKTKKAIHDELELEWKKLEARKKARDGGKGVLKIFLVRFGRAIWIREKARSGVYDRCGKMHEADDPNLLGTA